MLLLPNCAVMPEQQGEYHFKPNKYFKTGFEYYPSVGWDASYEITDSSVVKMQKRKISPKHPLNLLFRSKTGGDKADGYFTFKPLKPGNSIIKVHHIFRGKIEKTDTFNITVYF